MVAGFEELPTAQPWLVLDEPDKKLSQADKLVLLCQSRQPTLFTDQTGTAYARVDVAGVNQIMPLRSQVFKSWLSHLLWASEQKAPRTQAIYSALNVLIALAAQGPKFTLYNRVAPAEDGFWIDMTDERWRAIRVTAQGWEIVENPPILFKRYSHQLPLAEPKAGGDPWKLLDFINIDPNDDATRLTLLCTAISSFIPTIPHPITCVYGHQGSGKSWLHRLLRRVIDPSTVELLTMPGDERERVQQLDHHWCCYYDNVTRLPASISDTLCRAATGGGFTKRELYTDNEDVVYSFKRCVGLNGINIAAQRGDLLDRTLLIGLLDIPRDKRKTEQQLLGDFEAAKAEILGGFLDTLVKALQLYPSVNPKGLFRMADFTRWGCAIAVALGKTAEEFIDAYEKKVNSQIEEAAHSSPVATVLLDLMELRKGWDDTPPALCTTLISHAGDLDISTRQKSWAKAPHILVRQLNELAPSLKMLGWEVNTGARSHTTRKILTSSVRSVPSDAGVNVQSEVAYAAKASTLTSFFSEDLVHKIESLCRLKDNDSEVTKCALCSKEGRMDWPATFHDKTWTFLCGDCGQNLAKRLSLNE
jgi:energy-coupling factor transporter ATP-binding protein EcfA2